MCLLLLAALLACAGTAAPSALAVEGSSLQQLAEQQSQTETSTTPATSSTSTTSASEAGSSHTLILFAMGAAVVLLSGIAFVIVRDARRVAPAADGEVTEARSSRDAAVLMRKRRAKAKAARQQRKRNTARRK